MSYMTEIELGVAIDYDYSKPEADVNWQGSVDIYRVMLGNLDLIDYLSQRQLAELREAIGQHEDSMAADDIDLRADYAYENRRSA